MQKSAKRFDISILFRKPVVFIWLGLLLLLPFMLSDYYIRILTTGLVYSVVTLGLNFSLGYCGMILLCIAGMYGIGSYTSAFLTVNFGLSPWLGTLAAGAVTGGIIAVLGLVLLRQRENYFKLATLALQMVFYVVFINWASVTGGVNGITRIPYYKAFGFEFSGKTSQYYLILAMTAVLIIAAIAIEKSKYGRSFKSIQIGETATEAIGINSFRRKLLAMTLAGVYAGFAGAMYAHTNTFISSDLFSIAWSINILLMLMIGGFGSIAGCVFGAVLLTFLPEVLRGFDNYYKFIYGVLIVVIIVFLPNGIVGTLINRYREKYVHKAGPPPKELRQKTEDK